MQKLWHPMRWQRVPAWWYTVSTRQTRNIQNVNNKNRWNGPGRRLTERDEKFAVSPALVRRKREDTRHVIPIWRLLLLVLFSLKTERWNSQATDLSLFLSLYKLRVFPDLGEVSDDVRPLSVHLGEDVEDKGLHVEVKRLVIQEQLSEQTQVLTVDLQPVDQWRSENFKTTALET